jgi:hypothetical protein
MPTGNTPDYRLISFVGYPTDEAPAPVYFPLTERTNRGTHGYANTDACT